MKQKTVQKLKVHNKVEIKILSRQERLEMLIELFKKHIGRENGITMMQIFEYLYGAKGKYSELQIFYLWSIIKNDLNLLRRKTYYFVVSSDGNNKAPVYYVVKTMSDAQPYLNKMQTHIKQCLYMRKRCIKAVVDKFHLRL